MLCGMYFMLYGERDECTDNLAPRSRAAVRLHELRKKVSKLLNVA